MRIALMCTNLYPVPPLKSKITFPTLWITYYLAENLKRKGHEVFLFASSDSRTTASLISNNLPSLKKNKSWHKSYKKLEKMEEINVKEGFKFPGILKWMEILKENYEFFLTSELYKMAQKKKFDIIQLHSPLRTLHFFSSLSIPIVYTIHDSFSFPHNTNVIEVVCSEFKKKKFKNIHFVSVSDAQKNLGPDLNDISTIYNGIDTKKFNLNKKRGKYLAFTGRILPSKGAHVAVQVARCTKNNLKIAGPVHFDQSEYFNKRIKPYLSKKIIYKGLLTQNQMSSFYEKAEALLVPISWDEPFGLVMIESMACGTPVVAFNRGSVPEIIKDGETGFIVKNTAEMIKAIKKINQMPEAEYEEMRRNCRRHVEENFSIEKMVDNYEKLYYEILKRKKQK